MADKLSLLSGSRLGEPELFPLPTSGKLEVKVAPACDGTSPELTPGLPRGHCPLSSSFSHNQTSLDTEPFREVFTKDQDYR